MKTLWRIWKESSLWGFIGFSLWLLIMWMALVIGVEHVVKTAASQNARSLDLKVELTAKPKRAIVPESIKVIEP